VIVAISPHPDDTELGVAGYLARKINEGAEVHNVVVTVGDVFFRHLDRVVTADERMQECHAAGHLLGFKSVECLFPGKDTILDFFPIVEIIQAIDRICDRLQPSEVLIPLPSSHQDHEVVYRACLAAVRPSATRSVRLIAAYEYPATGWGPGMPLLATGGGMYVDVTDWIKTKENALLCYESQMRDRDNCFSVDAVRAMARMRGLECGVHYAELLHVMRILVR